MKRFLFIEAQKLKEFHLPLYDMVMPTDVVQPLGLVQLAAMVRQRDPGAEARILDLRLFNNDFSSLPSLIKAYRPEFIGFRGVSRDGPFMCDMIKSIRYMAPGAVLVAGGPHVSAIRGKIMKEAPLDFAVYGEGEIALLHLLDCLDEKGGYEKVGNLIYRNKEGKTEINPTGPYVQDLDNLPLPLWELLEHEQYFALNWYPDIPINLNARRELISIFTSRGCPYNCIYCHNIFGKKFRARSPENVVNEITYLYDRFGIRQFDIRDDIFNLDKKRVHNICDLIIERGLEIKFSFPNGLRADILDESLILKMRDAGLYRVSYALETASPRLQKMIRKNIDLEKLRHMIHFTSSCGILTHLFIMLGFPTETREELEMTIEYSLDPALDFIHTFTVNPFDGNEMAELLRTEGYDLDKFRESYEYLSVEFSVCEVSREELESLRSKLLTRFFTTDRVTKAVEKLRLHT